MDEPLIRESARRHGMSDDRMLHVVRTCPQPLEHPDNTGQVIFRAPDQRGVPLEVVAFEDDEGRLTIFHAMRMRSGYQRAYEEVMRHGSDQAGAADQRGGP